MFGIPVAELLWLMAMIAAGGVVTGLLAGLFGIGGGAVIVPVLYEVFRALNVPEEVRMQLCVGTSLAIIVPTTLRSYLAHRTKGVVIPDVVRQWTIPSLVGVSSGAALAALAPSSAFKLAFVCIAVFIASKMLFARDSWRLGSELPGQPGMTIYGFFVGLAASLMGVSGGSVSTMVLTLYSKPIHNAVATSAGVGVPITIAGTIGFMLAGWPRQELMPPFSVGFVSLIGFALMAPVASYTAPLGARLAHATPRRRLEIAFGCFLLLIAARFLAGLIF